MSLPYNSGTAPTTLCCQCGVPIVWNPQNLCTPCIALLVDIAEDIPKDGMVTWCRTCGRFLNPPNHWMPAALESKELLGLCLKRIRGLNKVRLIDARWIWTEPHSNRLKIELTIQKVRAPALPPALCDAYRRRCSRTPSCKRVSLLIFR
jgi:nonsense-mediated mRNA decay protein 3